MSEQQERQTPFKTLGTHLKYLREQSHQTVAEVSGAVEIDDRMLELIEEGSERPSEDILLLLISHFGMQDQEAVQLWELAGYEEAAEQVRLNNEHIDAHGKQVVMLLAMDLRTAYSDGFQIDCGDAGVTLTFTQQGGKHASTVGKVGMSYEQAARVLHDLQSSLLKARYLQGPKRLPPPKSKH